MNNNKLVLACSSWIAHLIAMGGHIFTIPITSRLVEAPYVYIAYAIIGTWMLLSLYGTVVGAYSIWGGIKTRHRAVLLHGLVGFGIGMFLILTA